MSDVAAAFDRVIMERLLAKLSARCVPEHMLEMFKSWLGARTAKVDVGGCRFVMVPLTNMDFQGTVWGPMLWISFYAFPSKPIRKSIIENIVAGDLNAFKIYRSKEPTEHIPKDMDGCQSELHIWGRGFFRCR
jgi:hypothetical protein